MQKYNQSRPDRRAGNCVNRERRYDADKKFDGRSNNAHQKDKRESFTGKPRYVKKPYNTCKKEERNPLKTIPPFMIPRINKTASDKTSIYEEGGAYEFANGICIRGNSKLIVNQCGKAKRPIYVYNPHNYKIFKSHKRSLLFFAQNGDYIISESHKIGMNESDFAYLSLYIFKVTNVHRTDKASENVLIPVVRATRKIQNKMVPPRTEINTNNPYIMMLLREILNDAKLDFLMDSVALALDKSNQTKTTYVSYHNSPMADKYKNA